MYKKKTFAIILSLLLCISIFITYSYISKNGEEASAVIKAYAADFSDVNESDWFYEDVKYASENNLMNGTSETEFMPDGLATRGMIVTILWRLEGEPIETGKDFKDVSKDAYYYNAVAWASNNQIVSGYSETIFGPEDTATREQFATILYRYAAYKKYDTNKETELDKYSDKLQISDYAVKSIKWANANGILSGTSAETISPKDNVQRCQIAAILKRFCVNVASVKFEPEVNKQLDAREDLTNETPVVTSGITAEKTDTENSSDNKNNSHSSESTESTNATATYTSPTIIIDDIDAKPGDEIKVPVKLKCNPGILGMVLTIYYDETKCILEKVENGEALKDILDFTTSKTLNSGARFVWDGIDLSEEDIKDGEILIMTFKVHDDATKGSCPVTIKYFDDDIVDNNLSGVYPHIENGEITINS